MLARVVLIAVLLQSAGAFAQTRLKVTSPAAVLNDPKVQACRMLAARRTNPNAPDGATAVEVAGAQFNLGPVIEAMALCREALALYPTEPSVITAEYTASETFKTLLFGFKRPDDDADLFRIRLAQRGGSDANANAASAVLFLSWLQLRIWNRNADRSGPGDEILPQGRRWLGCGERNREAESGQPIAESPGDRAEMKETRGEQPAARHVAIVNSRQPVL